MRKSLLLSTARAERRILDEQLSLAPDIQFRLTRRGLERGFGIGVAVFYKSAMWVGGDYYDVWSLENGRIAFAVGDVSGKGLLAAMIMSNLQAALKPTARSILSAQPLHFEDEFDILDVAERYI